MCTQTFMHLCLYMNTCIISIYKHAYWYVHISYRHTYMCVFAYMTAVYIHLCAFLNMHVNVCVYIFPGLLTQFFSCFVTCEVSSQWNCGFLYPSLWGLGKALKSRNLKKINLALHTFSLPRVEFAPVSAFWLLTSSFK